MEDNVMDSCKKDVDQVIAQVNVMAQKVHEIEQFYLNNNKKQTNNSKGGSGSKDKDKERHAVNAKKQQQDAASSEAASTRMQDLIRQFGTMLHKITVHKWAWPFMEPVDVEGLGLLDYYEIVEKPMDFGTIKKQIEAKDGSGYKHVREICADVRLVFKNAMKYNDEKNDVHVMAKTLLAKFEEKWLVFLPKVVEEEKKREEEEVHAQLNTQLAQESAHAKMARELNNELFEVDMHLEDLREQLVQKCSALWAQWIVRNNKVINGVDSNFPIIFHGFLKLVEGWCRADVSSRDVAVARNNAGSLPKWVIPPPGRFKVNIDAAIFDKEGVGLGCVVRDDGGSIVCVVSSRLLVNWNAQWSEFAAVRFGLLVAQELGLSDIIVESDSLGVVSSLNKKSLSIFVQDIRSLALSFKSLCFSHVKRCGNCVAHYCARLGSIVEPKLFVIDCFPKGTLDLAALD